MVVRRADFPGAQTAQQLGHDLLGRVGRLLDK
jgi:hypothetical protein